MGKLCDPFFRINLVLSVCVSGLNAATSHRRSPSLTASPGLVILGVTPTLTINCSYPAIRSHDLATITSLTIYSRTNSSAPLHKRGVVKVLGDNMETKALVSKNAEGDGVISDKGESFLFLRWSVPSCDQVGEYLCVLTAENIEGGRVQSNAGTRVTSRTPWHIRDIQHLEDGYKNLLRRVSRLEENIELETKSSAKLGPQRNRSLISQPSVEPYKNT